MCGLRKVFPRNQREAFPREEKSEEERGAAARGSSVCAGHRLLHDGSATEQGELRRFTSNRVCVFRFLATVTPQDRDFSGPKFLELIKQQLHVERGPAVI